MFIWFFAITIVGPEDLRIWDSKHGLRSDGNMKAKLLLGAFLVFNVLMQFKRKSSETKKFNEAVTAFNKCKMATDTSILPRTFGLKLNIAIRASPNELASALSDERIRPLWEPSLRSIARKRGEGRTVEMHYEGTETSYSIDY